MRKRQEKNNKKSFFSFFIYLIAFLICFLLSLFKVKYIPFVILSVITNILFIMVIRSTISKLKIEFSKKEKRYILITIFGLLLFYLISVLLRKYIYYWDFSCYYGIQGDIENAFNTSIFDGIKQLVGSTWSGEYGSFLSFFPEFLFNFTSKTPNAYVMSCAVVFIPYLVITISILIKKIIELFNLKKENHIFISALIAFVTIPIVHTSFILGQPDILGLSFIFLIIALTIDYDFYKKDLLRLVLIGILTFSLIISRRWYMYFVLVYFLCYGVSIIVTNFKDKERLKEILKYSIKYLLIVIISFTVTLFPLFKKILTNGFEYDYYLSGGFFGELQSQIGHLGFIILAIIIVGIIYGIKTKKYRLFSILTLIEYFLIIFIFTRTQNMGLHHSLLLVYIYLYFIFMFIVFVKNNNILLILTIIILLTNFGFGMFNQNTKVFTDVSLSIPYQEDYDNIEKVANWLKDNLNDDKAYMITHNSMYNPDKLRTIFLPDTFIKDRLPYGSAIEGIHTFPTELFDSKYIITTTPFDKVSIEYIYNDVFNELVEESIFSLVKEFDMNNGYKLLVYKRDKELTIEEINKYKDALKELSEKYPDIYNKVIEDYEKENM